MTAFTKRKDGIRVRVRATAGARCNKLAGIHHASDGASALSVKVRARPEKGNANQAIVEVLATALGVAKSCISIKAGESARNKTLEITGNPEHLLAKLAAATKITDGD